MIAFSSGDDADTQIYLVNFDGTGLRQVTNSAGSKENPAWPPDGTQTAFWLDLSGNREISAIGIDRSGLIPLTNDPAQDENPSWLSQ